MSTAVLNSPAAPAVTPPPARLPRPVPQPFRWTIEQYQALSANGFFHGLSTVLIDGEVYVMPVPDPPHAVAYHLAQAWLQSVFTGGCHVRGQHGFDIGIRTDPGPDLAVVPGSIRDYLPGNPRTALLIVEVSESSLEFDMTTKAEWYATAGVPDYWVLDLVNRRLVVYRDPEPLPAGLAATAYRTRFTLGPTDTVSPLAAPAATVTVADLLP